MLHTIGLITCLYLTVSTAAGIVIGRAIRFAGNDDAEHPLIDQPTWTHPDARRDGWTVTDLQSAPRPGESSSPGRAVASR